MHESFVGRRAWPPGMGGEPQQEELMAQVLSQAKTMQCWTSMKKLKLVFGMSEPPVGSLIRQEGGLASLVKRHLVMEEAKQR